MLQVVNHTPFSAALSVASNRITSTGCVFDARTRPQPSGNSTRTPSTSTTRCVALYWAARRATTSNFSSSGQSMRSSGVLTILGKPATCADKGWPESATISSKRHAAYIASSKPW